MNLPKVYEPQEYENDIYALWENASAFEPQHRGNKASYSVVIPPPNANGDLHLGHGDMLAIEDIIIRYQRMRGKAALLLPGADHAGFETQVVYEKELAKKGKSRFDYTREELYSQIWDFVAQNKDNYESQFRRLGASLDWSRYVYTLDDKIVKTAYQTFKKMWDDKLIYRGERLVNFCTFHGTGFADIEVAYKNEKSYLWHLSYPLTDGDGEIVVATTRPETMLGDVAVAVHPKDPKYKRFLGKTVKLPLTNREIPIISDEMVDREFGTGAVKITPAHDQNDYEVAERHDLPRITVIDFEGKLNHEVPEAYRSLAVEEARKLVVADLKEQGHLVKEEAYEHSVGHCYKCGTVIQPLLREQWFIDIKPLAKPAIKALQDKKITFYPDNKRTQLVKYYEGLKDWNISRQIAWGIPIPAFQSLENPDEWIYDERVDQEEISVNGKAYRRDPDVFDTWFSSSSWPYATLDFPDGTDFNEFYPLSLMETGADILYPWVSRMVMFGLYMTDQVPFKEVYLHGLIQDEHGAKMSKSKGNVINPMDKVDVFGSDAFRMGIIADESPANNRPYDESKLVGARNFCNKLWNIARFVEDKVGDEYEKRGPKPETNADDWMIGKLSKAVVTISEYLDSYRFSEAYDHLYHLVWDDFADWYIEASKTNTNTSVLAYSLETILKLTHPFAPFVTETIWQTLKWEGDSLLATSSWPKPEKINATKSQIFEEARTIITEIRNIKAAMNLRSGISLYHIGDKFLEENAELIKSLARLQKVETVRDGNGLHLTQTPRECWLDVDQQTIESYHKKLLEKEELLKKSIGQLEGRLNNPSYTKNAPKELVEETKQQLKEAKTQLEQINSELKKY